MALHGGSLARCRAGRLRSDRQTDFSYLQEKQRQGEIITDLLYTGRDQPDDGGAGGAVTLRGAVPWGGELARLQEEFR